MNLNKKSINKDMMPDSNTRASVATTNIFKSFLKLSLFNFKGLFKSFWIPLLLIIAPIGIGIGLSAPAYASPSGAAAVAFSYLIIQGALVVFPIILIYERSNNTFLRFKLSGYNSCLFSSCIIGLFFLFPSQIASQPGIVTAMALNPIGAMTNIFAFAGKRKKRPDNATRKIGRNLDNYC